MNAVSAVRPHYCHQCGKSFGRRYNLRRHAEHVHAMNDFKMCEVDNETVQSESSGMDEPDFKKRQHQDSDIESCKTESTLDENDDVEEDDSESETEEDNDESSDEDGSSSDLEDNAAYRDWLNEAKEAIEEIWSAKYEKYINGGYG